MKSINKRKITIIILLIIMLIIEIIAFSFSRAEKIKEIEASIIDITKTLQMQNIKLNATDSGESGYYIVLPEEVENRQIISYTFDIISSEETDENTETNKTTTKKPGEKIYLTEQELENAKINLNAKYDTKEKNGQNLYNTNLIKILDDKQISVKGYMPEDATLNVEIQSEETVKEQLKDYINNNVSLKIAYDIKIVSNEKVYEPNEVDENVQVTITGIESVDGNNQKYKVVHIDENNKIEEIENITKGNSILFDANTFSTYAVLLDETMSLANIATYARTAAVLSAEKSTWDGTVATGFKYGDGTQANPYLITNAKELAYLRDQVNNGTTYENTFFQLTTDIDLNSMAWTPIGNNTNSFRGTFDGAGHIISNTQITISALATSVTSYGFFGSVGGGNSTCTIKNVEFDSIQISITARGTTENNNTTKGYHIGIVAGTVYKNTAIVNNIVKNCTIDDTNTITIRNSSYQFAVGGIAGYVSNTSSSETDPGAGQRYSIENCFADVEIAIDATLRNNTLSNAGQYAIGGIVGIIRSQPVWPSNCLYVGSINGNGFIGPIFGYLRNSTAYTSTYNFATLWNGNDAGNLTMDSYFNSYSAKGTYFTQSVTSGTSTERRSNTTNNIGYVQGVNKGIYQSDISTMLSTFNNYAGSDYLKWEYTNGTFSFITRFGASIDDSNAPTYKVVVDNEYSTNLTYKWYINGTLDDSITGDSITKEMDWESEYDIEVLVYDGQYYSIAGVLIPRLTIEIEFDIDNNNDKVTARLTGTALPYVNLEDYTYQWYTQDLAGGSLEKIDGQTSLTLENLEKGMDYRLIATNNANNLLSAENSFTYGDRIVVYVNYQNGSNYNDGYTPQTPVQNLQTAYSKLSSSGTRNENIIVMMGNYTDTSLSFYNSQTATTYAKKVTITGKYAGVDYNAVWRFGSTGSSYYFRYLTEDTTFMYLTLNGGNGYMYLICQGHSFTIGEQVTMDNYTNASSNQGLLGSNAPGFHLFAGWYQYNRTRLPNNNSEIIIKSGSYGRIVLGGTPGTSSGQGQTTSHDFMGSSMDDSFKVSITVDIQNSTTASEYDYDVNLLVGGSACGNNYSVVTENIKSGSVGRLLGGSIGDSATRPSSGGWWGGSDWDYPENTFLGTTTINISGGSVNEVYGGCLGRNMNIVGSPNATGNTCDSYFYGTATINITGGTITNNIYGAGAGGVTGYSVDSSDPYKSYGEEFETTVNINISGGTIGGNIYGGGYGYTEYLNANVTAVDGGALYGDSNIVISGSPTINGNIYAAGCGYDLSSKPNIAQMTGKSTITINGTPTINGYVFGAGAGITGYSEMAKLIGDSTININANLYTNAYGGGNIAKTEGNTYININSGNHTAQIYGGGNLGVVDGDSHININGGTSNEIYGGGQSSDVTNSYINILGGKTNVIYGGSNITGTVQTTNITGTSGTADIIFGGNNVGGNCEKTDIVINGTNITEAIYGGGNQVNTDTSNITINSTQNKIPNIYGGGNEAGVTTTNVMLNGGTVENVFGGSNNSGTVETSNITTSSNINATNLYGGNNAGGITKTSNIITYDGTIQNIYGGNNDGGITETSNVTTEGGTIENVYGGGNRAEVQNTNVFIKNGTIQDVYGGGNAAAVQENTNVEITGGQIQNNIYGGGNEGTVQKDTNVLITNGSINGSAYAGGNGTTATVYENANITIDGETIIGTTSSVSPESGCVFGGGKAATTGTEENNNSQSTVNIVGGTIYGNVYGGANTSKVFGITNTNIGYIAVGNDSLQKANILITGTVFGGGEANASGSEVYDFSYISVTKGININIDGNTHNEFAIRGSIFGSGNASSTSGESYVIIKNYGTIDNPQKNISIQRATIVTLDNSAVVLSGATDRTNEYSSVYFTFSRVDHLKLKNNSTVYLNYGANLLQQYSSLVDNNGNEELATVQIDKDTGETTRNVDNRIYMYEGKNLNIATNEQVTAYGMVNGMTFLGLYTNLKNPSTSTGLYNHNFNNNDEITNAGTFSANSYVLGMHKTNHNIEQDGFYTNYNNEGYIKTGYVEVTPEDDMYYIWSVGEQMDVTTFEISMTASKYATLGTYELPLTGFSKENIKFSIAGFSAGLADGISLVDGSQIEAIAADENTANTVFGLNMKTGKNGWKTKSSTDFYAANGVSSYHGSTAYDADNSPSTPSLTFCFYHSQNLTQKQELGNVRIRFQVLTPIDDLNYELTYMDININLLTALFQDNYYEAAVSPGEEFDLFTTTETNITDSSIFSTYYSLFINEFSESDMFDEYSTYHRTLVSTNSTGTSYVYPENTKITMLDLATNKHYYYVVTKQDEDNNKYTYNLSDFIEMGTTNKYFNETEALNLYYNQQQDLIYEKLIFHINFKDSNIAQDAINNSLLMELRNSDNQTLIGVLGIQRDTSKYSVYTGKDAVINVDAELSKDVVYLGQAFNLNVTADFEQKIFNTKTIYDTQYFDNQMGIKISFFDSYGNQLNGDSLVGTTFELDGIKYYPRMDDGSIRIKVAEKVSNVLARIRIDTKNNTTMATGTYKIKVETFGSPDGIYYGIKASDYVEKNVTIINGTYGLKAQIGDKMKIIDKATGKTLNNNNSLIANLKYSSSLEAPKVTICLQRRSYDTIYSLQYETVDLADYITDFLDATTTKNEYLLSSNPAADINYFYTLKDNLKTGTYKLVFKLYDNNTYIGEAYDYFIIK